MSKQLWLRNYPVSWNLVYPEISLYRYLIETTAKSNDLVSLVFFDKHVTFREMHENIDRFAAALTDLGVEKGDSVAVMLPNCPEYVYTYFATLKLGAIVAQLNPAYSAHEVENVLNDSGAKVLVGVDGAYTTFNSVRDKVPVEHIIIVRHMFLDLEGDNIYFHDLLEKYPPESVEAAVDPREDVAVYQYTGGTTGLPKAAMLTHYNILCNVIQRKEWYSSWIKNTYGGGEITQQYVLAVVPLCHSFGMTSIMNFSLTMPAGLILMPRFDLDIFLDAINHYRPKIFSGVPTMYTALINLPEDKHLDLSCLEICNSGAAPLPVEVIERFEQRTSARIIEGYGLSEASPATHANPFRGIRRFGSIGMPYPDTDCKIVDLETGTEELAAGEEGELIIKGPQVMKGYLNSPEETAETLRDGWLYTGDIAIMDESGYFYIVDRKKDMIITGGLNVYPREVDDVIYEYPKVAEAVCVGVRHEYYGEVLKAYIVLKEGEFASEEEIQDHCLDRLAVYKVPRIVEFPKKLPKSAAGKLLRRPADE